MLRKDVLRKQEDFNRVYKKGKSVGDRYVVIFCLKNDLGYSRTSYLASKKVGNSVHRNRARRLMRESVRLIGGLPQNVRGVMIEPYDKEICLDRSRMAEYDFFIKGSDDEPRRETAGRVRA